MFTRVLFIRIADKTGWLVSRIIERLLLKCRPYRIRSLQKQLANFLLVQGFFEKSMNCEINLIDLMIVLFFSRAKGIRNLGDIFPNLTVVRGMQLYKDYAIVVYDSAHLEVC